MVKPKHKCFEIIADTRSISQKLSCCLGGFIIFFSLLFAGCTQQLLPKKNSYFDNKPVELEPTSTALLELKKDLYFIDANGKNGVQHRECVQTVPLSQVYLFLS